MVTILRRSRASLAIASFTSRIHLAISSRIFRGIRLVRCLAVRIGGDQTVANIVHVDLAVGEALPGMRIGDLSSLLDHLRGLTPLLATTTCP